MQHTSNPKINIWFYNHLLEGVTDQIEYTASVFTDNGYNVTFSRYPRKDALNIVIENFSKETSAELINFCKTNKKSVAVIMTEYIDFDLELQRLLVHGAPLWTENDYMHPQIQIDRLSYLINCLPYINSMFTLGDLPELHNLATFLPGVDLRRIPFPKMRLISDKVLGSDTVNKDFIFTGFSTKYREKTLYSLQAKGLQVYTPKKLVSKKNRELLVASAKSVLNLPQRADWRWISLMRVLNGLRLGRPTISIDTHDASLIVNCCQQIDTTHATWHIQMQDVLNNWQAIYKQNYEKYIKMTAEFLKDNPFPHELLEYWAITDNL